MIGTDVVLAALALVGSVAVGLVVHELAHALVLRLARIEYTVTYFPGRSDGVVALLSSCPWAAVEPHPVGRDSSRTLRLAAIAPVFLAVPVFAVGFAGLVPTGSPIVTAIGIGWLACSIPSPQDFSVAFHADRALATETDAVTDSTTTAPLSRAD